MMVDRLADRASPTASTAIVLGGSSGIGRATVVELVRAGMRVVAGARRLERLRELAASLGPLGERVRPVACDVSQPEQIAQLVEVATQWLSHVDLLVYATGTNTPQRALSQLTVAGWHELLEANLTGAFLATRSVLPLMRERGGLVVYVSSAAVQHPDVSGVAYQASKHGLAGLAAGTRVEERAHRIRTTVVYPGLCDTEILTKRPVPTPAETLSKALRPEDVARAIRFLAETPSHVSIPELPVLPADLM